MVEGAGVVLTGPHNFIHLVRRRYGRRGSSCGNRTIQFYSPCQEAWCDIGSKCCGNRTTEFYVSCQEMVW